MSNQKESDLYLPLKAFLQSQGYEVKGEVHHCDVLAVRGDEEPVVVELKLSLNLAVVLQAVDRLSLAANVYIAVPASSRVLKKQGKQIVKLLKMLGLGLMSIDPSRKVDSVKVRLEPCEYVPRKSGRRQQRLLAEFKQRRGDPNLGGTASSQGIVTAYRQRSRLIARFLFEQGASKASIVAENTGDKKARDILYNNYYGWFARVATGVYDLTPQGKQEISASEIVIKDAEC